MSGSGLLPCKLTPEPHFAGRKSLLKSRPNRRSPGSEVGRRFPVAGAFALGRRLEMRL